MAASAFILAGLTHSGSAVKLNTDSEWGIHMVPLNGMGSHEFFLPQVAQEPFGMGHSFFEIPSFMHSNFDGFGDIERNMARMENHLRNMDEFPENGDGNMQSQSFSSSYSSETGADGKQHTKTTKSGKKTVCENGKCKVVECADGKCKETEEPET